MRAIDFLDGDSAVRDVVPGPSACAGQVISALPQIDFVVIGMSLDAYFMRLAVLVERGALVVRDRHDLLRGLAGPDKDEWRENALR